MRIINPKIVITIISELHIPLSSASIPTIGSQNQRKKFQQKLARNQRETLHKMVEVFTNRAHIKHPDLMSLKTKV